MCGSDGICGKPSSCRFGTGVNGLALIYAGCLQVRLEPNQSVRSAELYVPNQLWCGQVAVLLFFPFLCKNCLIYLHIKKVSYAQCEQGDPVPDLNAAAQGQDRRLRQP